MAGLKSRLSGILDPNVVYISDKGRFQADKYNKNEFTNTYVRMCARRTPYERSMTKQTETEKYIKQFYTDFRFESTHSILIL